MSQEQLRDALQRVRDRFFPESQPERDRDVLWQLVNDALATQPEQANGGEAVYQIRKAFSQDGEWAWRDATEAVFNLQPQKYRRILYTHPAPAASVSDAVATVRERYRGTKWGKAAECICDAVDEALLALRPAQDGVPDAIEPESWHESSEQKLADESYCKGWNACRDAMLAAEARKRGGAA